MLKYAVDEAENLYPKVRQAYRPGNGSVMDGEPGQRLRPSGHGNETNHIRIYAPTGVPSNTSEAPCLSYQITDFKENKAATRCTTL